MLVSRSARIALSWGTTGVCAGGRGASNAVADEDWVVDDWSAAIFGIGQCGADAGGGGGRGAWGDARRNCGRDVGVEGNDWVVAAATGDDQNENHKADAAENATKNGRKKSRTSCERERKKMEREKAAGERKGKKRK